VSTNNQRRDFMKKTLLGMVWAVPVSMVATRLIGGNLLAQAQDKKAPAAGALPMLTEKDPAALALGYQSDATKVDVKKYPKRAGAEGGKQFCRTCMFFQAADPKTAAAAPCQLFPGKQVSAKGWCNSWAQNPKLKA
jgi:hypothetical protein